MVFDGTAFELEMRCEDAAFAAAPTAEVARILRALADAVEAYGYFDAGNDYALRDINRNEVGFAGVYGKDGA